MMDYNVQPVKWCDGDCKAEVLDSKGEVVRTIQYDLCSYRACKQLYFSAGGKFMGGDK
jgi:hypothetical protein